ncbi:MAG: guanylate kinase, partial [Muribaculaceae bacterium]|nr:guanylate kinase [Muribaculaceae bacterium]
MKKGKVIVVSAPSGTGKSTIINAILQKNEIDMRFSVSATNRAPRPGEIDGINYNFLTTEKFRSLIDADGFVEWEEVYPGRYYGTLKSEIAKSLQEGHNVILDIDVKGAVNVKKMFGHDAITIFIEPPSVEVLGQRLLSRGTETPESLAQR